MGIDVATIGETMALLVPDPPKEPALASSFRRTLGGAESNVAITLARLGANASWHSALGDDAFGQYIAGRITSQGVDAHVRQDPERQTALYVKEIRPQGTTVRYYRTNSAASQLSSADTEALLRMNPRIIHTTGITPCLSTQNRRVIEHLWQAPAATVLRSFDVNYRPALHSAPDASVLESLANSSDIVFCGDDEASRLWGTATLAEIRRLLHGPQLLVVKHGAEGATVFSTSGQHFVPAHRIKVVEVVGAGDALAAGFLYGQLRGLAPARCLELGTDLAARAVQITGDLPEVEPHPELGKD